MRLRPPPLRNFRTAVLVLTVAFAACSDHAAPAPGKMCLVMSDCLNPLSCSYGKCHEACRADGDCLNGMCVVDTTDGGASGLRVCISDTCFMNSQCPDLLVCARDFKCRQACATDKDCARDDDRCIVGGKNGELVCARPMEVDADGGVLKGDGPFNPPGNDGGPDVESDGGVPGDSGADGGGDAPADVPSEAGVDAPADVATEGGVDAPVDVAAETGAPDVGSDASADAGVDAVVGPCGIPEVEPNEDRNTATPYTLNTPVVGCIGNTPDHDIYLIRVPAGDRAGGYFRGSVIPDAGGGAVSAYVTSGVDFGPIVRNESITAGLAIFFYWAGDADGTYYLDVTRYGGASGTAFKYTLRVDYAPIADPYEPNDTADTPVAIQLRTPITAYYYTNYNFYTIAATEFQDWYKVELAAGPVMLSVENVPLKTTLRYTVYTLTSNVNVGGKTGPNAGGSFNSMINIQDPGWYKILIDANPHGDAMEANSTVIPDSFTRPYTLKVSQ